MRSYLLAVFCLVACVHHNPAPPKKDPVSLAQTQPTSAPTVPSSTPTSAETKPVIVTQGPPPFSAPPLPPKPKSEDVPVGQVLGFLQTTRSYCGGAPPPEELLKELRTPKTGTGVTLLFRKGESNSTSTKISSEVKTDSDGNFMASKLAPGTYCIVSNAKRKYALPTWGGLVADKKCYANWLKQCDETVTITKAHGEYLEIILPLGCGDPVCVPIPPRP